MSLHLQITDSVYKKICGDAVVSHISGAKFDFSNKRGIKNHLYFFCRANSLDIQMEYLKLLEHNGIAIPLCSRCGKTEKLQSFRRGFICSDDECVKKQSKNNTKTPDPLDLKSIDYQNFVKSNIDFYVENFNKVGIIDLYDGSNIGKLSLKSYVSRRMIDIDYDSSELWSKKFSCIKCGDTMNVSLFSDRIKNKDHVCSSRSCRAFRRHIDISGNFINKIETRKPDSVSYKEYIDVCIKLNWDVSLIRAKYESGTKITYGPAEDKKERIYILVSKYVNSNKDIIIRVMNGVPFITDISKEEFVKIYSALDLACVGDMYEFLEKCNVCGTPHIKNSRFCSANCYFCSLRDGNRELFHPVYNSPEYRETLSKSLKHAISTGVFTPNVTNSWCKSRVEVIDSNGVTVPCRSSWDATFLIANPDLEYETIRIPYIFNNVNHNYIVDFVCRRTKTIYEIKPDGLVDDAKNLLKREALIAYAQQHGFKERLITDEWFENYFSTDYHKDFKNQPNRDIILKRMKQFIIQPK